PTTRRTSGRWGARPPPTGSRSTSWSTSTWETGAPASRPASPRSRWPAPWLRSRRSASAGCRATRGTEPASRAAVAPLRATRTMVEAAGLPVEIVAGGSTGTWDIDVELPGLTELQAGSYCVMDLEYRKIGSRAGATLGECEMAHTVITPVVSTPTSDRAMVDGGLKSFSTDKPFPPESVERPGIEFSFAGDEHGRLTVTDPSRPPRLGERIEFFPPHCDPTINLYDRIYAMRGDTVEAVWEIAARGRSDEAAGRYAIR